MEIELKEDFKIIEDGFSYSLPVYDVTDKGLQKVEDTGEKNDPYQNQVINFLRGSKLGDEDVEKKRGTLHEHIISVLIHDLKFKNQLVPARETSMTIEKLQEALHWMRDRQINRKNREVLGTYKK